MLDISSIVALVVSAFLIFLVIVVTNSVVIQVICMSKKLRKPSNYGIVSISAADLLFVLYSVFRIYLIYENYPHQENISRTPCIIMRGLGAGFYALQLFTPVAVAVDRYIAVCRPLTYYKLNKAGLTKWILMSCWVIASLFGVLCLTKYLLLNTDEYDVLCLPLDLGARDLYIGAVLQSSCILAILILYVKIFVAIKNQRKNRLQLVAMKSEEMKSKNNEIKSAITMALIVATYIMCWIPTMAYYFFVLIWEWILVRPVGWRHSSVIFFEFAFTTYTTAIVDPIIYAIRLKEVKNGMSKVFCCSSKVESPNKPKERSSSDQKASATSTNERSF